MPAVATNASPDPEPDWSGLRAAAVAVGVREAARQAARHLPPDEQERFVERVMKRSSREGWLKQAKLAQQSLTVQVSKPMSAPVRTGSDAVANTLAEREKQTKLSLSKWTERASKRLASLKGDEALAAHQPAVSVASVMGKLWPEQAGGASVALGFFTIVQQREEDGGPVVDV